MGEYVPLIAVIIAAISTFSAANHRAGSRLNEEVSKIHSRIDRETQVIEANGKSLEQKFNDERVENEKRFVTHEHLQKYVVEPMEKGFDEVKQLIHSLGDK